MVNIKDLIRKAQINQQKIEIEKMLKKNIVGLQNLNSILNVLIKNARRCNRTDILDKYKNTHFEKSRDGIVLRRNEEELKTYSNILYATNEIKNELRKLME